jgi:hypothetical protein
LENRRFPNTVEEVPLAGVGEEAQPDAAVEAPDEGVGPVDRGEDAAEGRDELFFRAGEFQDAGGLGEKLLRGDLPRLVADPQIGVRQQGDRELFGRERLLGYLVLHDPARLERGDHVA